MSDDYKRSQDTQRIIAALKRIKQAVYFLAMLTCVITIYFIHPGTVTPDMAVVCLFITLIMSAISANT